MVCGKEKIKKELDAWSERFIFDPLSMFLLNILKNLNINPLLVTLFSLFFGLSSACLILKQHFLFASIFYFISVLLDNFDGKLARATNKETSLRKSLDQLIDQIVFVSIIISLSITLQKCLLFIILISLFFIYEVTFALRMIINLETGTKISSMKEIIKTYTNKVVKRNIRIINKIVRLHNLLLEKTAKIAGTWPYPKLADIHFLIILYLLLRNDTLLILSILIVFLELFISFILLILSSIRR